MSKRLLPMKSRKLDSVSAIVATASSASIPAPGDWIGGKFVIVATIGGTSPTVDYAIETTYDDGTTWIVCWRSAQLTSTGVYEITTFFGPNSTSDTDYHTGRAGLAATGGVISLPTPISDKIRITRTIGGTSPTLTDAVYFMPWRVLPAGGV